MGRLTVEVEEAARQFYNNRNGHLVTITDHNEALRVSSIVDNYCGNTCKKCIAGVPVVSLGEINRNLRNSNLFAVGLLEIKDKTDCPVVKHVNLYESKT